MFKLLCMIRHDWEWVPCTQERQNEFAYLKARLSPRGGLVGLSLYEVKKIEDWVRAGIGRSWLTSPNNYEWRKHSYRADRVCLRCGHVDRSGSARRLKHGLSYLNFVMRRADEQPLKDHIEDQRRIESERQARARTEKALKLVAAASGQLALIEPRGGDLSVSDEQGSLSLKK